MKFRFNSSIRKLVSWIRFNWGRILIGFAIVSSILGFFFKVIDTNPIVITRNILNLSSQDHRNTLSKLNQAHIARVNNQFELARSLYGEIIEEFKNERDEIGQHRALIGLGQLFMFSNLDSAEKYFQIAILYGKLDKAMKAEILLNLCDLEIQRNNKTKAFGYCKNSEALLKDLKNDSDLIDVHLYLGKILEGIDKLPEFDKSLTLSLLYKNKLGEANVYSELCKYYIGKDNDTSKYFCEKAINLFLDLKDHNGLGNIYLYLGDLSDYEGKFDNAYSNYNKSINEFQKMFQHKSIGMSFFRLGNLLSKNEMYSDALTNYNLSEAHFDTAGFLKGKRDCLGSKGEMHLHLNHFDSAFAYYIETAKTCMIDQDTLCLARTMEAKGGAYQKLEEYEKAIAAFKIAQYLYGKIYHSEEFQRVTWRLKDAISKNTLPPKPKVIAQCDTAHNKRQ